MDAFLALIQIMIAFASLAFDVLIGTFQDVLLRYTFAWLVALAITLVALFLINNFLRDYYGLSLKKMIIKNTSQIKSNQ